MNDLFSELLTVGNRVAPSKGSGAILDRCKLLDEYDAVERAEFARISTSCGCLALSPDLKYIAVVSALTSQIKIFDAAACLLVGKVEVRWDSFTDSTSRDDKASPISASGFAISKVEWLTLAALLVCRSDGYTVLAATGLLDLSDAGGGVDGESSDEDDVACSEPKTMLLARHAVDVSTLCTPQQSNKTAVVAVVLVTGHSSTLLTPLEKGNSRAAFPLTLRPFLVISPTSAVCCCVFPSTTADALCLTAVATTASVTVLSVARDFVVSRQRTLLLGPRVRPVSLISQLDNTIDCLLADAVARDEVIARKNRFVLSVDGATENPYCPTAPDDDEEVSATHLMQGPLNAVAGGVSSPVPISLLTVRHAPPLVSKTSAQRSGQLETRLTVITILCTSEMSSSPSSPLTVRSMRWPFSGAESCSFRVCDSKIRATSESQRAIFCWCAGDVLKLSLSGSSAIISENLSSRCRSGVPHAEGRFGGGYVLAGVAVSPASLCEPLDSCRVHACWGRRVDAATTDTSNLTLNTAASSTVVLSDLALDTWCWSFADSKEEPTGSPLTAKAIGDVVQKIVEKQNAILLEKVEALLSNFEKRLIKQLTT